MAFCGRRQRVDHRRARFPASESLRRRREQRRATVAETAFGRRFQTARPFGSRSTTRAHGGRRKAEQRAEPLQLTSPAATPNAVARRHIGRRDHDMALGRARARSPSAAETPGRRRRAASASAARCRAAAPARRRSRVNSADASQRLMQHAVAVAFGERLVQARGASADRRAVGAVNRDQSARRATAQPRARFLERGWGRAAAIPRPRRRCTRATAASSRLLDQAAHVLMLPVDRLLGVDGDELEDRREVVVLANDAVDETAGSWSADRRCRSRPARPRRIAAAGSRRRGGSTPAAAWRSTSTRSGHSSGA